MTFLHPWMFALLPLYLLVEVFIYYRVRMNLLNLPTSAFLRPRQTWRIRMVKWMRWMPAAALCLLLVALAVPQRSEIVRQFLPSGISIVVALDISGSMAAEDFQPLNRLEMAKKVLKDFVKGRPSDRIGLVLFAGRSITRSPLTLQHGPLLQTLDRLELGTLPDGTAIGLAIVSGLNRLKLEQPRKQGDRILVLITDGRNNAGEIHPQDALSIALDQKVKIYTVGVGSYGKVPFPVYDREGKKSYRYETADLDEPLLQQIASKTGGRYFRAADPESLQLLFEQINLLEKSEPQVLESKLLHSKSASFAIPATFILFCYIVLTIVIVKIP